MLKKASLFFLITFIHHTTFACSAFLLKSSDNFFIGFNENWKTMPGMVVVNKRGVKKTSLSWNYLSTSSGAVAHGKNWTSKYGSVGFSLMGADLPCYGMNEKGLYLVELYLDKTYSIAEKNKPNMFWAQWIQFQLDNYKDVNELLSHLNDAPTIDWWPSFPGSHFFIADRSGNTAVIELINGQFKIYQGSDMPIKLLCNNPYQEDLYSLNNFVPFGGSQSFNMSNMEWNDRFIKAAHLLNNYDEKKSGDPLQYSWTILDAVKPGEWQMVADVKRNIIYFRSDISTGIKEINLNTIDFSAHAKLKYVDMHIQKTGNIVDQLLYLSPEVNRTYTEKGFVIAYDNKEFPGSNAYKNIIENLYKYISMRY